MVKLWEQGLCPPTVASTAVYWVWIPWNSENLCGSTLSKSSSLITFLQNKEISSVSQKVASWVLQLLKSPYSILQNSICTNENQESPFSARWPYACSVIICREMLEEGPFMFSQVKNIASTTLERAKGTWLSYWMYDI